MQIATVCSRRHQRKKERVGWREGRERERGVTWRMEARGETEQKRERPLKEVRASWSLKWREAVAAAWGGSGLQPRTEALKHFSLF